MRTAAEHSNLQAVRRRGHNTSTPIEVPGWQAHYVLAKYNIGFRESFEKTVINHRLCALCRLLPWLKDCHQSSPPAIATFRKQRRSSNQASNVHVVSAGVGHGHCLAV